MGSTVKKIGTFAHGVGIHFLTIVEMYGIMTPEDLEESITKAYGESALDVTTEDSTVTVEFTPGEPAVHAKRAVTELTGHADAWTPVETSDSKNEWTLTYTA